MYIFRYNIIHENLKIGQISQDDALNIHNNTCIGLYLRFFTKVVVEYNDVSRVGYKNAKRASE